MYNAYTHTHTKCQHLQCCQLLNLKKVLHVFTEPAIYENIIKAIWIGKAKKGNAVWYLDISAHIFET